jgi:DUF4097 and DUF4098 domain-containing protein YvlB
MSRAASLLVMGKDTPAPGLSSGEERFDRFGLFALLALGLLLMLAAAVAGADEDGFTAKRTDHFNATLPPGSTLRIENVSGGIVAAPGKDFTAVVTLSVTAPTKQRAEELLQATTILQKRQNEELTLRSIWPYAERGSGMSSPRDARDSHIRIRRQETHCEDCKITAQYQVTIPAGVRAVLHTVNGDVRADGPDADLEAQSVNGAVRITGARRGLSAESVNGKIDVALQSLPPSATMHAKTVNGSVLVTLPKDARFDLAASTMNGTISSTFPLPARTEGMTLEEAARTPDKPPEPGVPRERRVVVRRDGDEVLVDVEALQREIEESMKQVDIELRGTLRDYNRELKRWTVLNLHREYKGSTGPGGGKLRVTTLNGSIVILAAGTREEDAKTLVAQRRGFALTIPEMRVHPRPVVRVAPHVLAVPEVPEGAVVRGDVSGDFLATSGGGTYRIGRVTGNVKILTHSGEIHVASAGAGADLKSYGGDIRIGPVMGDLKARTLAGEIRAGAVTGSAVLETSGGDIRVESIGGTAGVRTGGGDIVLPGVRGSIDAETGGGDVRVAVLSREIRGGASIRDSGGDVTLTLPSDFHGELELEVRDSDPEEALIRSDFPEVAVTRQHGSQRASGTLNGGGPRIVVRTHSGTIRVRRGPAASN